MEKLETRIVLAPEYLRDYEMYLNKTLDHEEVINKRVEEILKVIIRFCNPKAKLDRDNFNFWYYDAKEGEIGTPCYQYGQLDYCLDYDSDDGLIIGEWDYGCSMPSQFLTMTDKQIVSHLQSQVDEDERKRLEKLRRQQERQRQKSMFQAVQAKVVENALSKLTDEEKKALGY
jgi:hypothetical protein